MEKTGGGVYMIMEGGVGGSWSEQEEAADTFELGCLGIAMQVTPIYV